MGSSAVVFREKGFWCRDGALEFWLYLLADEVGRLSSVEPWLSELRDHWYAQSKIGGSGIIDVGLDDEMISDQLDQLIALNKKAITTLWAFGELIPLDYLNLTCAQGDYYPEAVPTKYYFQVGEYFQALLDGTLIVDTKFGKYGRTIPFSSLMK